MRGLEEEAQRQKSSALAVRAPTEVAIYALNKKRREIAHLESEYDLSIQFEAKDDMLAGTFEIERVGHRQPDDRARSLPDAEQATLPAPVEPQERQPHVQSGGEAPHGEGQSGAPASSKRRRRRRGRGRDRDRPQLNAVHEMEPRPEATRPSGSEDRDHQPVAAAPIRAAESETMSGPPSPHEASSSRKRRRRRRGRRPDTGNLAEQAKTAERESGGAENISAGNASSRTPRNRAPTNFEADLPAFLPNAPSEPVWSLSADVQASAMRQEEAPGEPNPEVPPLPLAEASQTRESAKVEETAEIAPPEPPKPEAPPSSPRRGWWQRPFRERE
jgi:ribonuclease E